MRSATWQAARSTFPRPSLHNKDSRLLRHLLRATVSLRHAGQRDAEGRTTPAPTSRPAIVLCVIGAQRMRREFANDDVEQQANGKRAIMKCTMWSSAAEPIASMIRPPTKVESAATARMPTRRPSD